MEYSCSSLANELSCDAQIGLAKMEVQRNTYIWDYSLNHPVCNRMHELMDRGIESDLFMTVGSSKKLCVDRQPNFADGPWKQQFTGLGPNNVIYTKYDQWTKAKSAA